MSSTSLSTSIKPVPLGSYLLQCFANTSKLLSLILTFYSVVEAANPSKIMAMNKFRKTKLTIKINERK